LQRLSIYPEFGGRSFQKSEIFSRNRELVAFLEAIGVQECQRPDTLQGHIPASDAAARIPRNASAMPDESNPDTDAERRQIQHSHNESKQIHF